MLNKLTNRITSFKKAVGIECYVCDDNSCIITGVNVAIKNQMLIIKDTWVVKSFNDLKDILRKKNPIYLTINGKGVISKDIQRTQTGNNSIESILPNANPNDFYIETIKASNQIDYISLIRKKQADEIIEKISNLGHFVIDISIGCNCVLMVKDYISDLSSELYASKFKLIFSTEKELTGVSEQNIPIGESSIEYLIGKQYIKSTEIIAFSGGATLLANQLNISNTKKTSRIKDIVNEFQNYRNITIFQKWVLPSILCIFFINILIYSHYLDLNKKKNASLLDSKRQNADFKLIKDEVSKKGSFLEKTGWAKISRTSYYADRIAGIVNGSLILSEMEIPEKDLLKSISTFIHENDIQICQYNPTEIFKIDDYEVETREIIISGSYKNCVQFIYLLEMKRNCGRVSHILFKTKTTQANKEPKLFCKIFIQNVLSHEQSSS